jgi:hypothetical protein
MGPGAGQRAAATALLWVSTLSGRSLLAVTPPPGEPASAKKAPPRVACTSGIAGD